MENELSKKMSEKLKGLQKKQYKSEEIMAPDIQLSKLQNMIRTQLMKHSDGQNIDKSTYVPDQNINKNSSITTEILKRIKIEEPEEINTDQSLIKHENEIANNINHVNIDNNSIDRPKNPELNTGNIKIEPELEGTSELLNQENLGITDTAHGGNIEYSFANIITMMAQIHGEECDVNTITNMNLSCGKPKDMEAKHTDNNIQPKLTRLVEVMRRKLQNKLNQAKPDDENVNKQSSNSENKCESVNVKNIRLSAEHCVTSSEKTVKRSCKTNTELDVTKHLYKCTICKAVFTNSSDFAGHLLKCEINKRILRSRHNMLRHVLEKETSKCTRTRGKKRKMQKMSNNTV